MLTGAPSPLKRLYLLLQSDGRAIQHIYIYALMSGLVALSLPLGIQAIVNLIQGGVVSTSWVVLVIIVVVGIAVVGILQMLQMRISETIQQKIFAKAAFDFATRLPRLSPKALSGKNGPELANRFFDTMTVQKGLPKLLIEATAAALQILLGLLLLSFYHPFFIAFSLVLALMVLILVQSTGKPGFRTGAEESKYKYQVAFWLEQLAYHSKALKLSGSGNKLTLGTNNKLVNEYLDARESHFRIILKQFGLTVAYKVFIIGGLLAIGGWLVLEEAMNIGQFIAAEIIILLIVSSIDKLAQSIEVIYDVTIGLEKLAQVTDLELDSRQQEDVGYDSEPGIAVHGHELTFGYADNTIVDDLSFHVAPSARVRISGGIGTGKSTLLNLMAGLLTPGSGHVRLGDRLHAVHHLEAAPGTMGALMSEDTIIAGTLRDNIQLNGTGHSTSEEDVIWAIEETGLTDYVNKLGTGLDTVLEADGKGLPSGIVKKILFARAIVTKPRLLLLDEPFLHLDEESIARVCHLLASREWTVIAVTNQPEYRKITTHDFNLDNPNSPSLTTIQEISVNRNRYA